MRGKDNKLSGIKYDLRKIKREERGKEFVIRTYSREEAEFARKFCVLVPHLYKVAKTFRPGFSPKSSSHVVKEIFYRKGSTVFIELNEKEVQLCKNVGLNPIPMKYKVFVDTIRL